MADTPGPGDPKALRARLDRSQRGRRIARVPGARARAALSGRLTIALHHPHHAPSAASFRSIKGRAAAFAKRFGQE